MEKEQVSDKKIHAFAKLVVHLDITRPYGDGVFDDPIKENEFMRIGRKRVELVEQIDKLDIATQKNIGTRYRELAEEYNKSLDDQISIQPNYNRAK